MARVSRRNSEQGRNMIELSLEENHTAYVLEESRRSVKEGS